MGLFDDLKDLKNVLVDVTGLDPFPEFHYSEISASATVSSAASSNISSPYFGRTRLRITLITAARAMPDRLNSALPKWNVRTAPPRLKTRMVANITWFLVFAKLTLSTKYIDLATQKNLSIKALV